MDDTRNKYARLLNAESKKEIRGISAKRAGKEIRFKEVDGQFVVSADVAYKYNLQREPVVTLRCIGKAYLHGKGRCQCKAELTPYRISVDGEWRYYYRSYPNHDNGEGDYAAAGGLRKGHLRFCPYGFVPDGKTSIEWVYSYETFSDSMEKSLKECTNKSKNAKDKASSSSFSSGKSKKSVSSTSKATIENSSESVLIETEVKKIVPKAAKDFWFASVNLSGNQEILAKSVMTPRNYPWFRERHNHLNGVLTLMAGLSPSYKEYEEKIKERCRDLVQYFGDSSLWPKIERLSKEIDAAISAKNERDAIKKKKEIKELYRKVKNKITILEDPFVGDNPLIIVLIDKLSPDGDWKHLTRKKIESKELKDFVFGGYSWESIKDKDGKDKYVKVRHDAKASYFAVMCDWEERTLPVDGIDRKMVIGSVYALGRQIDYFLEDDLESFAEKLRLTN